MCIFNATWFWRKRGIVVMSSTSRDAEYTARFIKRFGYGTARGSATRGGQRALSEMAACLLNGMDAGFTIDGPRGPAYLAKPGAVTLARHRLAAHRVLRPGAGGIDSLAGAGEPGGFRGGQHAGHAVGRAVVPV